MPNIFLSPSVQEYNQFINGGSEEYYMNLIADAMEPYLDANGIEFTRNNPDQKLTEVIAQSNDGDYDLHVAIHSNAAPESLAGQLQGPQVYYYPYSPKGQRFAEIATENFKQIYPYEDLVQMIPTTTLAEIRRTKAPASLIEVAYHDNEEDALWIQENIDEIARTIVRSITDYFDMPFVEASNVAKEFYGFKWL